VELTAVDVRAWLAEDVGDGDLTGEAVAAADTRCAATILLREPGVVSGLAACEAVFRELDPDVSFVARAGEGDVAQPGELAELEGRARTILAGERLALNLLGRLCGTATLTRRYVDAVAGTGATILDTRKTTPGLRALEKEAVRHGGGSNHRFGLYDGILLKENHIRLAAGIGEAVARARAAGLPVEVECETLAEVGEALAAGAERILLDNMAVPELRVAFALARGRV
jgi:nicotinate-nucleotide pyrophosphorylase (carboxylating)